MTAKTPHHKPVKLIIDEPAPGSFYWVLVQTGSDGTGGAELKSSEASAESYEAALASGTRALEAVLRDGDSQAKPA